MTVLKGNKLRKKLQYKYEHDFFSFAYEVLDYKALHPPLHRDKVCRFLTDWDDDHNIKFLALPREHLKSTLVSVSFPLWIWTLHPSQHNFPCGPTTRFLMGHAKRATAVDFLREGKNHLLQNERFRWLYPHLIYNKFSSESDLWKTDMYNIRRVNKDGTRIVDRVPSMMATGVGSSVVGFHFDYILADDLVGPGNVETANLRAKTLNYFQEIQALLRRGGKVIVPGTRWHHDDLYGHLIDPTSSYRDVVQSLVMKSGYADEDPIFPISDEVPKCGFDMKRLKQKMRSMGKYNFLCQYENDPTPDDENAFNEGDIVRFRFDYNNDLPTNKNYWFYTAVDPNRSMESENDPCAVVTGAIDEDGEIWIVDITKGHPDTETLVNWIRGHHLKWHSQAVIVETNNYQLQIKYALEKDQIEHKLHYPIIEAKRGPTRRKIERIKSMVPLSERGGLRVLYGSIFDELVDELVNLTVAKHDDMADATADIYLYGEKPRQKHRARTREAPNSQFLMKNILEAQFDAAQEYDVCKRVY